MSISMYTTTEEDVGVRIGWLFWFDIDTDRTLVAR